jgi:glycosyltransferase involved in cell wall biosynthesis
MKLTIAIPTYNRNDLLVANLIRLVPQLNNQVHVLVIDNQSDLEVEKSILEANLMETIKSIEITRNKVNIGGNANILRCFEIAKTEWLWILSDDDPVLDGAVTKILRCIEAKDSVAINFTTPGTKCFYRNKSKTLIGLKDLLENIDDLGNFVFVSSNVYNLQKIKNNIGLGYQYAYSGMPHVLMLIRALANSPTASVVLSHESIVEWCNPSIGGTYFMTMGAPTILEPPELKKHRATVLRLLRSYIPWQGAIHQITLSWRLGLSVPHVEIRNLRRRIWDLLAIHQRIQIILIQTIFLIPALGAKLIDLAYLLKTGKKSSTSNFGKV